MHLVSKISSLLNVKPSDKPELLMEFLPLPFDRYITIYNESVVPSNFYDYFNDVIDDIMPILREYNISIVQILNSDNEPRIRNCFPISKFSGSQINFLIKNSLLHICTDSYTNEICGILNRESICLVGNRFHDNSYSWYGDSKRNKVLCHNHFHKPSFSMVEDPKSINFIKTEDISNSVLESLCDKLSIKHPKISYKTIFAGSNYHLPPVCDYIPDFQLTNNLYEKFETNVRLDRFNNEKNCLFFCSNFKYHISLEKAPSEEFLQKCFKNCVSVDFFVDQSTDISHVTKMLNSGLNVNLFSKHGAITKDLSFKFLDFGPLKIKKRQYDKSSVGNFIFKTSKVILSKNKKFPSYAHVEKDIELGIINRCIDSELFFLDDDRYKIIGE